MKHKHYLVTTTQSYKLKPVKSLTTITTIASKQIIQLRKTNELAKRQKLQL